MVINKREVPITELVAVAEEAIFGSHASSWPLTKILDIGGTERVPHYSTSGGGEGRILCASVCIYICVCVCMCVCLCVCVCVYMYVCICVYVCMGVCVVCVCVLVELSFRNFLLSLSPPLISLPPLPQPSLRSRPFPATSTVGRW